jgi:hypothetical protein
MAGVDRNRTDCFRLKPVTRAKKANVCFRGYGYCAIKPEVYQQIGRNWDGTLLSVTGSDAQIGNGGNA